MNSIIQQQYPLFTEYQALRTQLMGLLSDQDLSYQPGGANLSLGALCREIGEVQHSYNESFRTFRIDFSYRNPEPDLEHSVARLRAWFEDLDSRLRQVVEALSEEDCQQRRIDRGGWDVSPGIQLEIYKEALLIFYGKASIYLKGLNKTLPAQWASWIA